MSEIIQDIGIEIDTPTVHPDESEQVHNSELKESEFVAEKKLETLMAELRDFSIRFVNSEEYNNSLDTKTLPGGQVFIFKSRHDLTQPNPWLRGDYPFEDNLVTFSEYLKSCVESGWARVANIQTDWPESLDNLRQYDELIEKLKQAHKEATAQKDAEKNTREKTLEIFREKIKELIPDKVFLVNKSNEYYNETVEYLYHINSDSFGSENAKTIIEMVEENYQNPIPEGFLFWPELQEYILQFKDTKIFTDIWITTRTMLEMRRMVSNDNPIVEFVFNNNNSQEALRKTINSLAYYHKPRAEDIMKPAGWDRQYHIAMIFSNKAIKAANYIDRWGSIDEDKRNSGEYLLGAISCMPNKELGQKMQEKVETAGNWSHPIFDSNGIIRYPKQRHQE